MNRQGVDNVAPEIRLLRPEDVSEFVALIAIFNSVFEQTDLKAPDVSYLKRLLQKEDFFVITAQVTGEVVGGLTVYVLHGYSSSKPVAYIYDVGMAPAFQRQGIGKKLFDFLTQYCRDNGFQDAYVEAEADDVDAINFYRSTLYTRQLKAVHFTYDFGLNQS